MPAVLLLDQSTAAETGAVSGNVPQWPRMMKKNILEKYKPANNPNSYKKIDSTDKICWQLLGQVAHLILFRLHHLCPASPHKTLSLGIGSQVI